MNPNTLKVTLPSDREARITRVFNAPRRLVWNAHVKPELVRRWVTGPEGWKMEVCKVDLRAGGSFRYELSKSDGTESMGWGGKFLEISEPEKIVHTELFDEDWTGGETTVTIRFRELAPDKTELDMTVVYVSKEARDAALQTGMTEGMEMSYKNMDALLAEDAGKGG